MVTLEQVRRDADEATFPRHVLPGCADAIILFAAAFGGKQDAIWIADAGLHATCVDSDAERMDEMIRAYPEGWEFVTGDAFAYATMTERRWDVVSVDCPTNLFDRCAELLPVWCLLARHAVVLGTGVGTVVAAPAGWEVTGRLTRSSFQGGVYWTVLEPC